ncbi:MAG: sulfatase [Verrucomicrobia bacterium]|nr:MAG: sulfatase [Verrucomicrobiota bacterium]
MAHPNIVLIVTDNQAPWTLGCYGNEEIRTPAIDRLATDGMRMTNTFCSNPVSSPNRATLLTGLMPSQHGVHSYLSTEEPDAQMGPDAYCTIAEFPNLPQMLADAGYGCGMSGKWHLGDSLHPQLGFQSWLAKPDGHTATFYDVPLIRDGRITREPRYTTEAIADHAVSFLHQADDHPSFLYVGFNGPYGLDGDTLTGHRNRHAAFYADQELACFPREPTHPWLRQYRDRMDNPTARRSYAAAVSGVDDGVDVIIRAISELGMTENTLVIFTSDHGFCGGHHGMWGMGDHSRPTHLYQQNLRIPLLMRYPARIPAGRAWRKINSNYDLFPTLLDLLGLAHPTQESPEYPGRSYADALLGKACNREREMAFHEYENTRCVQTPEWKLVRRHPDGPDELYQIGTDPEERRNRIDDASCHGVVAHLAEELTVFFDRYSDPQYDRWKGGRSKAGELADLEPI